MEAIKTVGEAIEAYHIAHQARLARIEKRAEWVEKVNKAANPLEIVGKYVDLQQVNILRYSGDCPFCKHEKCFFLTIDNGTYFYCFMCHQGGNIIKFVSVAENISYFDALKKLSEEYGVEDAL